MRTYLILPIAWICAAWLAGCADPYAEAKEANTIEAWEAYLAEKPSGTNAMMAHKQLTELLVARALETKAVADFDKALQRGPTGKSRKTLQEGRANAAFAAADRENTEEGWKTFLKENDFADPLLKKRAHSMVAVAKHKGEITVSEATVTQVNLAEDRRGELDGWSVSVDVTNTGSRIFDYLILEVQLLDAEGQKLAASSYPLVSKVGPRGMAIEEKYQRSLKPGETRSWSWTTAEPPEGWAQKARVVPSAIHALGEAPSKTGNATTPL